MNHITSSKSNTPSIIQEQITSYKPGRLSYLRLLLPGLFIRLGLLSILASLALLYYSSSSNQTGKTEAIPLGLGPTNIYFSGGLLRLSNLNNVKVAPACQSPVFLLPSDNSSATTSSAPNNILAFTGLQWLSWGSLFFISTLLFAFLLLLLEGIITRRQTAPPSTKKPKSLIVISTPNRSLWTRKRPFRSVNKKGRQQILSVFEKFL
ncbi:hypothetical protein SAMN05192529_103197 [Arachidicoccus rhizosphaerae]|uniref:Uncharacterized protein n=1 Tax=Arachidicoccus rhizosphaerae TaxID=551991 RepID=A0A1H3WQJ7_9BACT|nr:hypothetical protein [Arachidicoccus rhizosphaerae]SDZ89041.1 hypothetical protein SAMN05192529_103197 [Arachidicoccus rhizosphaerae]